MQISLGQCPFADLNEEIILPATLNCNRFSGVHRFLQSKQSSSLSVGRVDTDIFEYDSQRHIAILHRSRSDDRSAVLLTAESERRIEEGCDRIFSRFSGKRRAFERYVYENIENWVIRFGQVAGADRAKVTQRAASLRSLERRIEDPNAWSGLSLGEQQYHYGSNYEIKDCIDAALQNGIPAGTSTSEISAFCAAGLN